MLTYSVFSFPTGSGMLARAADIEEAKLKAREYAALLLTNDPKREHCEIEIYQECEPCRASGFIRRTPRCKAKMCKACSGVGRFPAAFVERFTRQWRQRAISNRARFNACDRSRVSKRFSSLARNEHRRTYAEI